MSTAFASTNASQEASHTQFPFVPNVVSIRTRRQMKRLAGTRETEADRTPTSEEQPGDRELSESKATVAKLKVNQIPGEMNFDQIVGNSPALRDVLELA